jgi:hypothetical protein
MIVDFQHHFTPRELMPKDLGRRKVVSYDEHAAPSFILHWMLFDLDEHIRMMDEAGIDVAFLSSAAGMCADLDKSRLCNETAKKAERDYPGRFIGAAHANPLGGAEALRELARCKHELGFPGVVITSETNGLYLDATEFEPFWTECARLGLFVFVHPALKLNQTQQFDGYDMARSVGREFSLVMATIRLINAGRAAGPHPLLSGQRVLGDAGQRPSRHEAEARFRPLPATQHGVRYRRLLRSHGRRERRIDRNPRVPHRFRDGLPAGDPRARGGARFRQGAAYARQGRRGDPVRQCRQAAEAASEGGVAVTGQR